MFFTNLLRLYTSGAGSSYPCIGNRDSVQIRGIVWTAKLIVFYNGENDTEDEVILRLSDAFKEKIRQNIRARYRENKEQLKECRKGLLNRQPLILFSLNIRKTDSNPFIKIINIALYAIRLNSLNFARCSYSIQLL